ncbi:MAG TPA: hypothetical protein VF094_09700 [Gaiellaceae bacterium]
MPAPATILATPSAPGEGDAGLGELAEVAHAVELRLSVVRPDRRATVVALGLDPASAQRRSAYFLDTPELALARRGVAVRVCGARPAGGDSLVRVRPVAPAELPGDLRRSPGFAVEVDASPEGLVCAGALRSPLTATALREAIDGRRPPRTLFSKEQRAFFALRAGPGVYLDELALLGPLPVVELRLRPEDFQRVLVAELWSYPDGSRALELRTRCRTVEAPHVAGALQAFLAGHRVDTSGDGEAARLTALEHFARLVAA